MNNVLIHAGTDHRFDSDSDSNGSSTVNVAVPIISLLQNVFLTIFIRFSYRSLKIFRHVGGSVVLHLARNKMQTLRFIFTFLRNRTGDVDVHCHIYNLAPV